jgi:hypothetical protein
MIINDLNPRSVLKMTRIIFFALIAGLLIFLLVVLFIADSMPFLHTDLSVTLMVANFVFCCIILPAGYLFSKMTFNRIDQAGLLKNKLSGYQFGQIIRMAAGEGIGMLAIASLLLTSNYFFLIFLLITLIIMIRYYPSPDRIGRDLNLSQYEIDMFFSEEQY